MTVNTDANVILMIGGVSSENNFATQLLEYDLSSQRWKEFTVNHVEKYATKRLKLYGHTTVYHSHSNTFYIYGGISYLDDGQLKMSSNLFSLHYPTKKLSLVSIYSNKPYPGHYISLIPSNGSPVLYPRMFHSSVTSDKHMIIVGGKYNWKNDDNILNEPYASLYVYRCNMWINLYISPTSGGGENIDPTFAGSSSMDNKGNIFVLGGISQQYGVAKGELSKITLPKDSCSLYASLQDVQVCKTTLGCAHCSVSDGKGANSTFCYSNDLEKVPF